MNKPQTSTEQLFPGVSREVRWIQLHSEILGEAALAPHLPLGVRRDFNSQTSGGIRKGRESRGRGMPPPPSHHAAESAVGPYVQLDKARM